MFMQMLENMQNTILQICKYNVWSIPNMQNIQNWKYEKCKCADYAKHAKWKMKNVYTVQNCANSYQEDHETSHDQSFFGAIRF